MKTALVSALTVAVAIVACVKPGDANNANKGAAKLVSVKMKMPTKIGDKDISGKLDGYHLSVKKTGGDCTFIDIDRMEKVSSSDVKIDASLKQGCDYSLMMSFGKASADGKKLDQVFLSSEAHDSKPATPTMVKKDDLKGKSEITIKACISVTDLGAKELGVSQMECPSVADDSVDAILEPVIAQATSIYKLSKQLTQEVQAKTLRVSGDVSSSNTATMFCALGLEVQFLGNTLIREMADDAIIEVKAGDKKSLSKSINIAEVTDQGPYQITEVRLMESCQNTKPDAATTALQMIQKCNSAKTCVQVK